MGSPVRPQALAVIALAAAAVLITAATPAIPQTPPAQTPPSQTPAPQPPPPVLRLEPGQEGSFPVPGEVVSATSSAPRQVSADAINTGSFRGVSFACSRDIDGFVGFSLVTYVWKDAQGNQQTGSFAVFCGGGPEKIASTLTVTGAAGERVRTDAFGTAGLVPDHYGLSGRIGLYAPPGSPLEFDLTSASPGTYYMVLVRENQAVLVTIVVTPRRVAQLEIPEERMPQVALQRNQCPPGLGFHAAYSTVWQPGQSVPTSIDPWVGAWRAAGFQRVHQVLCGQPGDGTGDSRLDRRSGWWALYTGVARVPDRAAAERSLTSLQSFYRSLLQRSSEIAATGIGDHAVGATGNVRLPVGDDNQAVVYGARLGNVVFWAAGFGQPGSLSATGGEARILPFMQQIQRNIESQATSAAVDR